MTNAKGSYYTNPRCILQKLGFLHKRTREIPQTATQTHHNNFSEGCFAFTSSILAKGFKILQTSPYFVDNLVLHDGIIRQDYET